MNFREWKEPLIIRSKVQYVRDFGTGLASISARLFLVKSAHGDDIIDRI